MKNALILHWWLWNKDENWFPWLKTELKTKNFNVFLPNLPNSEFPDCETQVNFIEKYIKNLKSWDYIIWHSLWATLALKTIEKYKLKWINFVLVWATYPEILKDLDYWKHKNYVETFFKKEPIKDSDNNIIVFLSKNDPYVNIENAKKYFSEFKNIKIIEFEDKWHFNSEAWISKLPEILDYIK